MINIDVYRVAANITEYHYSKLILNIKINKVFQLNNIFYVKFYQEIKLPSRPYVNLSKLISNKIWIGVEIRCKTWRSTAAFKSQSFKLQNITT